MVIPPILRLIIIFAAVFILLFSGCVHNVPTNEPTPTNMASPTVYITLTPPSPTPTAKPSPTSVPIPTATPTATPTPPPYGSYILSGTHLTPNTQFYFNPAGSSPEALRTLQAAMNTWDSKIPAVIFKPLITGNSVPCQLDGKNTIGFGPLSTGVLAETWCWGNGEIDMIFNTAYLWGNDPDGEGPLKLPLNTFDLQNTATHEFGHVIGLNDIYNTAFTYVTMYGEADTAETYKDSLSPPDIYGAQLIYGAS
jgi:hypothetical protein